MSNFENSDSVYSRATTPRRTKKNKIITPNADIDLVDASEKFTNNFDSIGKILNKSESEPDYSSQFDIQTFDSMGIPSAPNDVYQSSNKNQLADLERKISYNEGWTNYDNEKMSYGVIPENMLSHNNMVPNYNKRHGYGSNDLHSENVMNYKNELFTGRLKNTWKAKQENIPLFKPETNSSFVYGMPVMREEDKDRFDTSRYRQNEKPFEDKKVTPGVNLDYNEVGTHGFHSMWRDLGKTVDELRVKPKITYEGRIIDGKRGDKRPIQAPVMTYKPDTFRINDDGDMLPIENAVDGPKVRDNFIMKETDRAEQHIEYTGGAYTAETNVGRNVPEHMREKYKYADRQNFVLPKPMQKFSKAESVYNQNLKSYDMPATARSQTGNTNYVGTINHGTIAYTNYDDIAKPTIKSTTSDLPQNPGQPISNTMRGTVQPMDIANPTIKETQVENRLNPNINISDNRQRVYFNDTAKPTNRESTNDPVQPIIVGGSQATYTNWNDMAKNTQRQDTTQIPYNTNITPINQTQRPTNIQDTIRTTMRQDTVQIPYNNNITPIIHGQRAIHPQDLPKNTTKDTTIKIPYNTNITPINYGQQTIHNQDALRPTMRQDTVQIIQNNNITPITYGQRAPHPQDIANTTLKESVVDLPRNLNISPINHQQTLHNQDILRNTMRQDTVQIPFNNNVTPINQQQSAAQPQDIARTTLKQDIVKTPWNTIITPVNQQQRAASPQDNLNTTNKETTVCIPYNTIITPVNQIQRAANPQDIAKPTTRESLIEIPHNTMVTAVNGSHGRASVFNNIPLKATNRQDIIQIPYNTNITAVTSHRPTTQLQDKAKPTIKETTSQIPHNTHIGNNVRQPTLQNQDNARATTRQTTVVIPYNTNITGVSRQQGNATTFDRTPLKETVKETTIDNKYIAAPTHDVFNKGYGYMAEKMTAPNTNKQFTCQEVYITPAEGTAKSRPYSDAYNARIDDRKESLHWYRPPTDSNVNMGPDPEHMNVVLRDDMHHSQSPAPGFTYNSNLDRMKSKGSFKLQNDISVDRFIDPIILRQLESNEFNIPYEK